MTLGHRRLSVIDIEGGRQPMTVEHRGARADIVFSGEVYNYRELRHVLIDAGHRFATSSDTEVTLRGYLEWGDDVVHHLTGMYAFAIWDASQRRLALIRDRIGIKPLYYALSERGLVFGSEPKALLPHPWVAPVVDADGLREVLAFIKTPRSRPTGTSGR